MRITTREKIILCVVWGFALGFVFHILLFGLNVTELQGWIVVFELFVVAWVLLGIFGFTHRR
jgi:hypothetical protein